MKPLTIEEKAKAYDYAINKAKELILNENGVVRVDKPLFDELFPSEMEESEDERIRKKLIEAVKGNMVVGGTKDKQLAIAWLEKQGTPAKLSEEEQNRFAKGVLTSCASSFIDYLDAHKYEGKMCVSNGECEDIENAFHNAMWDKLHRYYGKYIEKQGKTAFEVTKNSNDERYCCVLKKQDKSALKAINEEKVDNANKVEPKDYNSIDPYFGKPIDKVEPKFKVGDWIVDNNSEVCQVTEIRDDEYCLWPLDSEIKGYLRFIEVDNDYHLWSIADAKDGDVLANDHHILILKELGYDWSSNGTPHSVKAYCGIKPNGNFEIGKDNWSFCGTLHIHPATKEQREQLEKAMADAGYVWLSGKKELKKIEELTELENESKSIFLDKTINWDEIRVQAAIAAMKGMLANATLVDDARLDYRITIEQAAVSYANTLVEELKKKG